ncbi:MAG TPA: metallophosphoesterase [Candidatus Eisenbacteria bacterium]|nr:metallophosphoesterase [Candidatus Eisenbacteria bacterium]
MAPYTGPAAGAGDSGVSRPAVDPDSAVILVYGDNRLGQRMKVRSRVYRFLRYRVHSVPARVALGIVTAPLLVLESLVPTLDGPRDIVTAFTHRPRAGGERQVLDALLASGPFQLVISTGDVVQDGRRARQWEDYVKRHRPLFARAPYRVAPGNHERLDTALGRASWDAALGAPPRPERYWSSVDLPDSLARFVFIDGNTLANVGGAFPESTAAALSQEQLAWADQALSAAFRYRFIVLHHPLVSAGPHPDDWTPPASAARRDQLLSLCRRHQVTAILAGHEHLYQRVFLRDMNGGGIWHVTTGGGGSPLSPVGAAPRGALLAESLRVDPESIHARSVYHYCRLVLPRSSGQAPSLTVMEVRGRGARVLDRLDLATPGAHP